MKCDMCGDESESLIGGTGSKLCDWCHEAMEMLEDDYELHYHGHGRYIGALIIVSFVVFWVGVAIGKYVL